MIKISIAIISLIGICGTVVATENISVKTTKLSEIAIYPERSAPATVISLNDSTISAQIEARVDTILANVGDIVEPGAVLAQLDCADYRLAHRQSVAKRKSLQEKYELAKRHLQRTRQLTLKESIAEEVLDRRNTDYKVLGAELEDAQTVIEMRQLDESRCQVRSPFRALVIEHSSAIGELVRSGTALVKILDIDNMEISAEVLSRDIQQIKDAQVLFFEHDNIRYPLSLRAVVQAINTTTRNREVRLIFSDSYALPGAAGRLSWRDQRTHIPHYLLVRREGQLGVFTAEGETARFNPMPQAQAGRANITTLPDNVDIVTEGHFALTEKVTIEITN